MWFLEEPSIHAATSFTTLQTTPALIPSSFAIFAIEVPLALIAMISVFIAFEIGLRPNLPPFSLVLSGPAKT